MITKKQRAALQRSINKLAKVEVANSWRRLQDPIDRPSIEKELKLAKRALQRTLDSITVEEQLS